MNILIVEDEIPKLRHLKEFIEANFPNENLTISRSYNSALEIIEDDEFDVILLDMSIPTYDIDEEEPGGRPQGFGGVEILRFMSAEGIVAKVVVITGYDAFEKGDVSLGVDELRASIENEFPELFSKMIYFNTTYDDWKSELSEYLSSI